MKYGPVAAPRRPVEVLRRPDVLRAAHVANRGMPLDDRPAVRLRAVGRRVVADHELDRTRVLARAPIRPFGGASRPGCTWGGPRSRVPTASPTSLLPGVTISVRLRRIVDMMANRSVAIVHLGRSGGLGTHRRVESLTALFEAAVRQSRCRVARRSPRAAFGRVAPGCPVRSSAGRPSPRRSRGRDASVLSTLHELAPDVVVCVTGRAYHPDIAARPVARRARLRRPPERQLPRPGRASSAGPAVAVALPGPRPHRGRARSADAAPGPSRSPPGGAMREPLGRRVGADHRRGPGHAPAGEPRSRRRSSSARSRTSRTSRRSDALARLWPLVRRRAAGVPHARRRRDARPRRSTSSRPRTGGRCSPTSRTWAPPCAAPGSRSRRSCTRAGCRSRCSKLPRSGWPRSSTRLRSAGSHPGFPAAVADRRPTRSRARSSELLADDPARASSPPGPASSSAPRLLRRPAGRRGPSVAHRTPRRS